VLEDLINLPHLPKKPRYIGFGIVLADSISMRFHLNPTTNGISFGPVIPGYDIHVTLFEKDGVFHSHLKYSEKGREPEYEPIITISRDEMVRLLMDQLVEFASLFLEKYEETDEALVVTEEGVKVLRELLKGCIAVDVRGRKLLFECRFGPLTKLEKRADRLFRIGTVAEAIENPLFGDRFIFSPDFRPIVKLGDEVYIHKQSFLEAVDSFLRSKTASVEEVFEELEKAGLGLVAKCAEMLGMRRLFIKLERRNLLEKWLSARPSI